MDEYTVLLYKALGSKVGIEVETYGKSQTMRAKFYAARRADPQLQCLSILQAPGNIENIWIIRKEIDTCVDEKPIP